MGLDYFSSWSVILVESQQLHVAPTCHPFYFFKSNGKSFSISLLADGLCHLGVLENFSVWFIFFIEFPRFVENSH